MASEQLNRYGDISMLESFHVFRERASSGIEKFDS